VVVRSIMVRSTRRLLLILVIAGSPCLSCWGCWTVISHPHDRFQRLLRGDPDVRVTRLRGAGNDSFVIDDAESLDYLTEALRAAESDGFVPKRRGDSDRTGPTLFVNVWTDRFGSYTTSFELPNDERIRGMTVCCSLHDEAYFYWVPLPEPVPQPLAKIFAATRKWDRDNRR
jgi:hypothetical protein